MFYIGESIDSLLDVYDYAESVVTRFIHSESNFEEFYDLCDIIYDRIQNGKITYKDLSREGIIHVHLVNVAVLSGLIAEYVGLDEEGIRTSILGGLVHDIGKFFVSDRLLNKNGRLTTFERIAISSHEIIGKGIVSLFCQSEEVLDIVASHHIYIKTLTEPVDISSLPREDSRLLPLICSVADITDAVVSTRPYKKRLPAQVARNDLHIKGIMDIDNIYTFLRINIE